MEVQPPEPNTWSPRLRGDLHELRNNPTVAQHQIILRHSYRLSMINHASYMILYNATCHPPSADGWPSSADPMAGPQSPMDTGESEPPWRLGLASRWEDNRCKLPSRECPGWTPPCWGERSFATQTKAPRNTRKSQRPRNARRVSRVPPLGHARH